MNRPTTSATASQRGQSVVEFLVLSVAFIPLFLLFPMIGKYQDIRHATQMASRYAAFDATTRNDIQSVDGWKPEAQLADEVRRRFFSNSDAPIKTNDVAGDVDANRNLAWRDPYNNPLIARFSDVGLSFGNGSSTHAGGFSGASDSAPFNRVPLANSARAGLQTPGIYTANVSVKLANLPAGIKSVVPFDTIDLSMQRHTSLLFEPWSSPSPQETENRFGRLAPVPTAVSALSPIIDLGVGLVDMFKVRPPEFGNLQKWRDAVPQDRLKPVE
ncbi:hypothetical protein QN362_07690 [Actimicrobium sp. CCC2.4]|uniref:hypothetical protein n=1 Tax=Actimicrobium sp. CCC2.4 TaxID=3048606 RepID=UPI002AC91F64|nr:hypothetical protein [Actimicrobium sp. CCC2.4]MEB0135210.1 hypothetical protein [Actimicrobium sp. CCC2.4]WPX31006.1 hypothetical protein RHM62_12150 [Actimicrobium sp. CCC2.4]